VLSGAEYATLVAACDLVYPRDDSPGASDLGAPRYIDWALSASPRPAWAEGFRTGLARLDVDSYERFAVPFYRATVANQSALVHEWIGDADDHEDAAFVRALVTATLEGVLCDPIHGGNWGRQGWSALGILPDPFSPSSAS
jgi:hypothetical protein